MSNVLTDRQAKIQKLLTHRGEVAVDELARRMSVTSMTIRRDLTAMERAGLLRRVHGGCVLGSPYVAEQSFGEKERVNRQAKLAIARQVVEHLEPGMSVYLDTGTTALYVARSLPPHLDLRVSTNNLRVAMELFGRDGVEVVVYGGELGRMSPELCGELAVDAVRSMLLDVAVLGADAVDADRGELYAAEIATAALSRAARAQASTTIIAVDSAKFGKRGRVVVGRLQAGMTLITDAGAGAAERAAVEATGATLVTAT